MQRRIADAGFLARTPPEAVSALLPQAVSDRARLAAQVYRSSMLGRGAGDEPARRRELRIAALRWGDRFLADALASQECDEWRVDWATGSDVDHRLFAVLPGGAVDGLAGVQIDGGLAVVTVARSGVAAWDAVTGSRLWLRPEPRGAALALTAMRDRPVVLAGGSETLSVIDVMTGEPAGSGLAVPEGSIARVAVGGDRQPVAVTLERDGRVTRWDMPSGRVLGVLPLRTHCFCLAVGERGGRWFVATGHDEGVAVWDLVSGEQVGRLIDGIGSVYGLVVDGQGALAVVNERSRVLLRDPLTGKELAEPFTALEHTAPRAVGGVWHDAGVPPHLATLGGVVLVPGKWRVHLWDPRGTADPLCGPTAKCVIGAVHWGDRPFAVTGSPAGDAIAVWDLTAPRVGAPTPGHAYPIRDVAVSEGVVVALDAAAVLCRRDLTDGVPDPSPIDSGFVHPNSVTAGSGTMYAGGGEPAWAENDIGRWSLTSAWRWPAIPGVPRLQRRLSHVVVEGRALLVAVGGWGEIRVMAADSGDVVFESRQPARSLTTGTAIGNVDGRMLVAVSVRPGTVSILDLAGGGPLPVVDIDGEAVIGLAAVDGRPVLLTGESVAGSGYIAVKLRGLHDGAPLGVNLTDPGIAVTVAASTIHRGRPVAAVATSDGSVRLVDLSSGDAIGTPLRLTNKVNAMVFTEDQQALVVAYGGDLALLRPPGFKPDA